MSTFILPNARDAGGLLPLSRRRLLQSGTMAVLAGAFSTPLMAQEAPKKGGVLRIAAPFNPSSLDPLTGGAGSDHMLLYPLFDTLVDFEPATLAPRPGLATSWEFTDPKTLVLTLRQGVRFHDGEVFDAAAVKAHLDRARSDPRSSVKGDIASLESVEVLAPDRVALHLNRPDTALPLILADRAGMVTSPKGVAEKGQRHDREPVGTGPFKLQTWNDNDVVVMVRNPDYWNPRLPHLDGLTFRIITDLNTGLRSVIAGENDFAYRLNPQQKFVADRTGAGKIVVASNPTIADYHLVFNYKREPLNNVKVRQAINYAIDRDAFNKAALMGLGVPAQTMLPPGYWAHDSALDNYYAHDPEKARALLKEAGFPNGVDISFFGNSDQASQQRHEIIMEQLRQVGIRTTLISGSNADMYQRFMIRGEGDMIMTLWTGRPDPSLPFLLVYGENGFNNAGKVPPPPELAAAQIASQTEATEEGRKRAFAQLEKAALDHALSAEIAFVPGIEVYATRVKGYEPNLLGKPKLNGIYLAD
ncbi:peptide/nickel transport system permease protein/peptide/nickel transport system substrate-binding protein [Ancylobacter aquaticus]|uniref:Peptide/nickel transport system permease protein/peptide/nickel transport system substrate-binding protein n=1 Tax=Ancylobacter aquaticus TaxID=100 RepID=A0A4R1I338_ANCAQ|nr:ABC transporter substrate-binding protein [Ancylobacter aquaticus]TCK28035.1 peptide/nickel transport system permease protein/peptide/nickel transport system substrate-binding protein [Ancylobacter aquaticus]